MVVHSAHWCPGQAACGEMTPAWRTALHACMVENACRTERILAPIGLMCTSSGGPLGNLVLLIL